MKKRMIIAALTMALSINTIAPSIMAHAAQIESAIIQNEETVESIETREQYNIFTNEETGIEESSIEPRASFDWSKAKVTLKNWTRGVSGRVKKWTRIIGVALTIYDTVKIAIDWLTPVNVDYVYVGDGYTESGDAVKTVQRALNEKGFQAGTEDGLFGPNTKNAIKRFQQYKGLSVDGIVGPNTWKYLLEE